MFLCNDHLIVLLKNLNINIFSINKVLKFVLTQKLYLFDNKISLTI